MKLFLWKDSFEKISSDLELVKKKKQALDDLLTSGKISEYTHKRLNEGLDEEVAEIENRKKVFAEKMNTTLSELEHQIQALELFLGNLEMAYTVGGVNEELYKQESTAVDLGLGIIRRECVAIKDAITAFTAEEVAAMPPEEVVEPPVGGELTQETPETQKTLEMPVVASFGESVEAVSPEEKIEEPIEAMPEVPKEEEPSSVKEAAEEPPSISEVGVGILEKEELGEESHFHEGEYGETKRLTEVLPEQPVEEETPPSEEVAEESVEESSSASEAAVEIYEEAPDEESDSYEDEEAAEE